MNLIEWRPDSFPGTVTSEDTCENLFNTLNLTASYGEREYIRHAFVADVNNDGKAEIITRTMNNNQARAIDGMTGETVWVSPNLLPPPQQSSQVSQISLDDIDDDGIPEVILATYNGDLLCVNAANGAIKWQTKLPWLINNPRLDIKKANNKPGKNVALTVGAAENCVFAASKHARPRINMVHHPDLVLINADGSHDLVASDFSEDNGNGHNTWMFDIDGDGLCEIICSGHKEIVVYHSDGRLLSKLPCKGEGTDSDTHPDDLHAFNWDPARPGKELIYLDGTDGIIIADSSGAIIRNELYPKELASHLQNFTVFNSAQGPALIAENIRAKDSKLLYFNHNLEIEWAAMMESDMTGTAFFDWDGDGEPEIITGSHGKNACNPNGVSSCSLQVMKLDGTPVHWHHWHSDLSCGVLDVADVDGDGQDELLVGVGTYNGPEGRFSMAENAEMKLYTFKSQKH